MTIEEYARAIAEVVRDYCGAEADGGEAVGPRIQGLDLDAIIASVEKPGVAIPTCPPGRGPQEVPAPDVQALRGQIESEVWEARKRIEAALHAEIAELRAQIVDVVFDGPPGPEGGRFVECEDADGVSINAGNWWQREDGYWALRIVRPPTRTVQAQNRDHDAEMFRRGWVAGQADALKQIDAARAEEREKMWLACSEVVIKAHQKHGYNDAAGLMITINDGMSAIFDDQIRARSGAKGV